MPSKPTPARALAAALLLALAVPALRTSTVMPALHAFLNAAVALPLGVGKLASLGSFALQVLVDGNKAPVDGREGRLLAHVLAHSLPGDLEGALAASIDYQSSAEFFMSVGTDKGKVLTDALANATSILELGTYCGFGTATLAAALPSARITTLELLPRNAAVAAAFFGHAGVAHRVDLRVGSVPDVLPSLVGEGARFDAVFIDHHKDAYAPDAAALLDAGLLAPGAVLVADNIKVPGAPAYAAWAAAHPRLTTRFVDAPLEWLAGVPGAGDVVAVSVLSA